MKGSALVIDDDALSREFLAEAVRTAGYRVRQASDGDQGIAALRTGDVDIVFTDLRMPGRDGLAVLRAALATLGDVPVVVLTAFGTVETAVEAMRVGAEDFLLKPVSPEQIEVVLGRIEGRRALVRENKVLKAQARSGEETPMDIIGKSPSFLEAVRLAERVAATDATVLVRGESGTGKEVIATVLHVQSSRSEGPFIKVNCAALTESLLTSELFGHERGAFTGAVARKEGRFELAAGGTLFLDEIGELPGEVQAKLLRVLETGEFERVGGVRTLRADARIVAATNRDLERAMKDGRFREDLYYRLNVVPVWLPPLRERIEDVHALAEYFLARYRARHGVDVREFTPAALDALRASEWPGNIRELANVVQRAVLVARGRKIGPESLGLPDAQEQPHGHLPVGMTLEAVERQLILRTLESTGWNRTKAAALLEVTPRTLSNKIRLWRAQGLLPEVAVAEGGN